VFVTLIVASFNHLASVGLVLFEGRVGEETNVVVHVKVEEWTGLATGFVDYEVVEGVMLEALSVRISEIEYRAGTNMWNDQILLRGQRETLLGVRN
jgi:hypothetical protein